MRFMNAALLFLLTVTVGCADAGAADQSFQASFTKLDTSRWYVSSGWANGNWQGCEWRKDAVSIVQNRLRITLSDRGGTLRPYGCGEVQSKAVLSYGLYEVRMRAAAGSGLNSAFFTYTGSPTHDEIDFEFLGKNPRSVNLNVWTGGKAYAGRVLTLPYDASKEFHTYAFEWTPTKIRWLIDGKQVHETPNGTPIPSHGQKLFMSLWSGAGSSDAWMGKFTYTLPVTADVEWVRYTASQPAAP